MGSFQLRDFFPSALLDVLVLVFNMFLLLLFFNSPFVDLLLVRYVPPGSNPLIFLSFSPPCLIVLPSGSYYLYLPSVLFTEKSLNLKNLLSSSKKCGHSLSIIVSSCVLFTSVDLYLLIP